MDELLYWNMHKGETQLHQLVSEAIENCYFHGYQEVGCEAIRFMLLQTGLNVNQKSNFTGQDGKIAGTRTAFAAAQREEGDMGMEGEELEELHRMLLDAGAEL